MKAIVPLVVNTSLRIRTIRGGMKSLREGIKSFKISKGSFKISKQNPAQGGHMHQLVLPKLGKVTLRKSFV